MRTSARGRASGADARLRWLHRVAAACTIVLMSAVAACNDQAGTTPPVAAESVLPDSAEQLVFGVDTRLTNLGVAKGHLLADRAYTYSNGQILELRQVNVTFFDGTGAKDGTLTSIEGTLNQRLNRLEARGDVVLVSEDGRRLETPKLIYDQARNQVFSDTSFVLNEPGQRQLSGIGFESDPQLTSFRVLKGAKGVAPVTIDNP